MKSLFFEVWSCLIVDLQLPLVRQEDFLEDFWTNHAYFLTAWISEEM